MPNKLKPQLAEQVTCSAKAELAESDVMRALECCSKSNDVSACMSGCPLWETDTCPCVEDEAALLKHALALLREKDAEIERLMREKTALECVVSTERNQGRAEAISEFAERFLSEIEADLLYEGTFVYRLVKRIAKEMKGEGHEGSDAIDRGGSVLSDRTGEKED